MLWQDRAGVVARAALLVVLGVLLGRIDSPPLVILLDFGLMFLGATFFLGLSARALWLVSAVWVVAVPLLSFKVRTGPSGLAGSPDLPGPAGLLQPLVDHALASSYPVLPWLGYVLVGMALGRSGLQPRSRQLQLLLVGAAISVAAKVASWVALAAAGGVDELDTNLQGLRLVTLDMGTLLEVGLAAPRRRPTGGGCSSRPRTAAPRWTCCTPVVRRWRSSARACSWSTGGDEVPSSHWSRSAA